MNQNALYYPFIDFVNPAWLKAVSLFYDRIYRIVPDGIIPSDPEELQPLLEDGSVGTMIDPVKYSQRASEEFLAKLTDWSAAALHFTEGEEEDFTRIHRDKADQRIRDLFKEIGYKEKDDWYFVPTELASNYMLYLAREIGIKNKLDMITTEWAPWTAVSYFNIDGRVDESIMSFELESKYFDDPYALFSLVLSNIFPVNIGEIPAEKIRIFREKRKDEISSFRAAIFALLQELQVVEDPVIRLDLIQGRIKDFNKAISNYRKSADIIKAKGWFGISFMGFPAPVALGKLFNIPHASTIALVISALAIGGLFNIKNTKNELEKLKKESPISCLVELKKSFKNYTSFRGGGDINYKAFNCMEEYVND